MFTIITTSINQHSTTATTFAAITTTTTTTISTISTTFATTTTITTTTATTATTKYDTCEFGCIFMVISNTGKAIYESSLWSRS